MVQLGILAWGSPPASGAVAWRMYGDGPDGAVIAAQAIRLRGLLLFAAQVVALFAGAPTRPAPAIVPRSALRAG